jgi:hypothetical protein
VFDCLDVGLNFTEVYFHPCAGILQAFLLPLVSLGAGMVRNREL